MKELTQVLHNLRVGVSVTYFDEERKRDQMMTLYPEHGLSIFNGEKQIKSLSIHSGDHNIYAISFKQPEKAILKELYSKIGIGGDYPWSVEFNNQLVLILRVPKMPSQFKLSGRTLKRNLCLDLCGYEQNVRLTHVLVMTGRSACLLKSPPSEDKPPYEIDYMRFLSAVSEFVDVDDVIEEEEMKVLKAQINIEKEHVETPYFPIRIYSAICNFFKAFLEQYKLPREKDIALLSMIGVLSSVMPNVTSRHRNKKIWTPLYVVVSAPPASGKGVVADPMGLIQRIERTYRDDYEQALKEYRREYARFKAKEIEDEPTRPTLKTIQLPTDTSFIALFEQLMNNGGSGLMLETEIDSFVNAGKQEWGNYSVLNRKATHHEPHLLDRKTFEQPLYLESPKIAMVLAGTTGQFFSLFPSTEDGLFSRFLVYCYQLKQITLVNPYLTDYGDFFDSVMSESADTVDALYQQLTQLDREIEFRWTIQQSNKLYGNFYKMLQSTNNVYGENSSSVVLRLMLAATRIGMVLTAMEAFEKGTLFNGPDLTPGDHIADVVIDMVNTCAQHSLLMMANIDALSKKKPLEMKSHNMLRFFNALPEGRSFKTKDAMKIGLKAGVSERSVGDYLNSLCKSKHLEQTGYGEYRRMK